MSGKTCGTSDAFLENLLHNVDVLLFNRCHSFPPSGAPVLKDTEDMVSHKALFPQKTRCYAGRFVLAQSMFLLCLLSLSFRTINEDTFLAVDSYPEAKRLGLHQEARRKVSDRNQVGSSPVLLSSHKLKERLRGRGGDAANKPLRSVAPSRQTSMNKFKPCRPHLSLNEHFVDQNF